MSCWIIQCDATGTDKGGAPTLSCGCLDAFPVLTEKAPSGVTYSPMSNFDLQDGDTLFIFCTFANYEGISLTLYDNLSIGFYYGTDSNNQNFKDVEQKVDNPRGGNNKGRTSNNDTSSYALVNINQGSTQYNVTSIPSGQSCCFTVTQQYTRAITRNQQSGTIVWAWALTYQAPTGMKDDQDFELFVDFGDPHRGLSAIRCCPRRRKSGGGGNYN